MEISLSYLFRIRNGGINLNNRKFDISAYLRHIGMEMPEKPDLEYLEKLTRAHLLAVPFENLTVCDEHKEPSLDPDDLFDKVVNRNRGGYCFELNKLFYLLLQGLGYTCYPIPVRVIHKRVEPCAISHRATIVVIDGKRYYGDVGFGGAGPKGVLFLDTEEEQLVNGERFRVRHEDNSMVLLNLEEGFEDPVLRMHDMHWLDPDFLTLNRYYSTYHGSPVISKRLLYISTPRGWKSLANEVFTVKENGVKTVQTMESREQEDAVVRQHFGLAIPVCTE